MKHLIFLLCFGLCVITLPAQRLSPRLGWLPPTEAQLDSQVFTLQARPHLWWNGFAGLQPGVALEGGQPGHRLALLVSFNTGLLTVPSPEPALQRFADSFPRWNYDLRYQVPLSLPGGTWQLEVESAFRDGLHRHGLGVQHQVSRTGRHTFAGGYRYLLRRRNATRDYLLLPDRWTSGRAQAYFWGHYQWERHQADRAAHQLTLGLRATGPGSEASYSWLEGSWTSAWRWRGFDLRGRFFARYGSGLPPAESRLYLAGASPEEMWTEPLLRARGWVPAGWLETNLGRQPHHLHYGGGLNLRGYAGYRAEFDDGDPAWYGSSGAALNLELAFDRWITLPDWRIRRYLDLDAYLFYDAGLIAREGNRFAGFVRPQADKLRQDAGLGLGVQLQDFAFFHEEPLILQLDLPLFLSNPPFEEAFLAPRWVVRVGRAF